MFDDSSQLLTATKRAVIKSLSTVQKMKQWSAVVKSWEELPNIERCKQNCRIPQSLTECIILNSNQGFINTFSGVATFTGGQNYLNEISL